MDTFNIAISASKEYIPYAKVMILAFCKKHSNSLINLFVFHTDTSIINLEKDFLNIVKSLNKGNNVEFVNVDYQKVSFVDNKIGWPVDLWARWYLFDYLVDKCDRVLSIGIDTMVIENISDFYFQELENFYF